MKDIKIGFFRGIGYMLATLIISIFASLIFNASLIGGEIGEILTKIKKSENFTLIMLIIAISFFVFCIYKAKTVANEKRD